MAPLPGDKSARLIADMNARHRADALAKDPSSIPGMTQSELNEVINTGTISTELLREIL